MPIQHEHERSVRTVLLLAHDAHRLAPLVSYPQLALHFVGLYVQRVLIDNQHVLLLCGEEIRGAEHFFYRNGIARSFLAEHILKLQTRVVSVCRASNPISTALNHVVFQ